MGLILGYGSDAGGVASPSFRRSVVAALAEKFYRALAARLARRNPMKSIAAISRDGSCE